MYLQMVDSRNTVLPWPRNPSSAKGAARGFREKVMLIHAADDI
jgi:hypothetical protein